MPCTGRSTSGASLAGLAPVKADVLTCGRSRQSPAAFVLRFLRLNRGVRRHEPPGALSVQEENMSTEVTVEMLQAFADAWNRHDPDALMTFMSDDCVFEASAGAEVSGTRYTGREAVKAGYIEVFATFPDAH